MGFGLRRSDLQANAERKLADAQILLQSRSWSNAYYLAGYAVELALKSCIARQMSAGTIPDKSLIEATYKHDFRTLIGAAGLSRVLKEQEAADPAFAASWAVASEWSPTARYEARDALSAQLIVDAISNPKSGVLQWIRMHW